jgi:hypothetical protein
MDPFIETSGVWEDFHRSFLTYARDLLLTLLPDHYDARLNEYSQLVNIAGDEPQQRRYPDVAVTRPPGARSGLIDPVIVSRHVTWDEETAAWLEIHSTQGVDAGLVTIVELLSPANKTGEGYRQYLLRRDQFLSRGVSLVEIDLLLRGRRLTFDSPLPQGDYYVYVTRGELPGESRVYRWPLSHGLPAIPIPLRNPDPDVELDLAAVFGTTYERGRYERRLKYATPDVSGLEGEHLEWARRMLSQSQVAPA